MAIVNVDRLVETNSYNKVKGESKMMRTSQQSNTIVFCLSAISLPGQEESS